MNLCSHTNFGALFSTVDVDFRFFAHIKIFEIASAKLRERQHWQTISYSQWSLRWVKLSTHSYPHSQRELTLCDVFIPGMGYQTISFF